ncbi:MAG: cytochrome c maturation protein CcmE [Thermoplasmatales archaeon]|nr:MAG: cytochrome c maturation protein CcmE [Thermoplasmatales archaeon]
MKKRIRKISEGQIKIVIVVFIVVIILALLLWGMVPGKIYDVSEILKKSSSFDGQELEVTGIVTEWTSTSRNFTLVDSINNNYAINVTHTSWYPEGFGVNETIVVSGIFLSNTTHIESKTIQIGCPSKY